MLNLLLSNDSARITPPGTSNVHGTERHSAEEAQDWYCKYLSNYAEELTLHPELYPAVWAEADIFLRNLETYFSAKQAA